MDNTTETADAMYHPYHRSWCALGGAITAVTVIGNVITISAILLSRKLRSMVSNQFIFSLAVSDLLVGATTPYHMAFYLHSYLGTHKLFCLMRFVLLEFAFSSSITNLVAIAADRYIAIVYPLHYNRFMTRKMSFLIIGGAWTSSFTISCTLLGWNDWKGEMECNQTNVIPPNYMNFVVGPCFVVVWLVMTMLYSRIYREAADHQKRLRNASSVQNLVYQRESKSIQVMVTILGCFTICWLPYLLVVFLAQVTSIFRSRLPYEVAFYLAVSNSGMNPVIYAWKNQNFRTAFLAIIKCTSPNLPKYTTYITNHIPSKKNSVAPSISDPCLKEDVINKETIISIKTEENGSINTEFSNMNMSPEMRREA